MLCTTLTVNTGEERVMLTCQTVDCAKMSCGVRDLVAPVIFP